MSLRLALPSLHLVDRDGTATLKSELMKILERIRDLGRNSPNVCAVEDIEAVCRSFGLDYDRPAHGSHHIVSHPQIEGLLTVPANRPIKPLYLRLLTEMISSVEQL